MSLVANGSGRPRRPGGLWLLVGVFVAGLFFSPVRVAAQTPADSANVLLDAANRFESRGRQDVAEAIRAMIVDRFPQTVAANEVRRLQALRPMISVEEESGKVELQVWSTLYGAWLGIAIPMIADADGPAAYGTGLLLGAPAGFFASRAYSRFSPLSEGQARAITWGGTWGTWQGFGWAKVMDLGEEVEQVCPDPEIPCYEVRTGDSTTEVVASMVAGGLTGIVVGGLLASRPIPAGLATTVNFGSLWGTWFGFGLSFMGEAEGDALLAGMLLGGNAGLVTTALLGPDWNLSQNRARLISIAGVVGGVAGAGIDLIVQPDNARLAMAVPLAGSAAGLALGALLTGSDPAPSEARAMTPGAAGFSGSMVRVEDGRWTFNPPTPTLTMVRDERVRGGTLRPAIGLKVFDARF